MCATTASLKLRRANVLRCQALAIGLRAAPPQLPAAHTHMPHTVCFLHVSSRSSKPPCQLPSSNHPAPCSCLIKKPNTASFLGSRTAIPSLSRAAAIPTYLWDLNYTGKAIGCITAYINVVPRVGSHPLDSVTDIKCALAGGPGEVPAAVTCKVGVTGGAVDGLGQRLQCWGCWGLGLCSNHAATAQSLQLQYLFARHWLVAPTILNPSAAVWWLSTKALKGVPNRTLQTFCTAISPHRVD